MSLRRIFEQVLDRPVPEGLDHIQPVAQAAGLSPPAPDADPMPLVTPFATVDGDPVGILHWPTPGEGVAAPVVRQRGHRLELRAPSVRAWLRQTAARLEAAGELSLEVGASLEGIYDPGEHAVTGLPLVAWTLLRDDGAPWAYEGLMHRHRLREDHRSALITAERAADRFSGWAEPHAWRHALLLALGDTIQARDAALAALSLPVWTLVAPIEPLAESLGWQPPFDGRRYAELAADTSRLPADRAAHLMDHAALDGVAWASTRDRLQVLYREAGLTGVADLVAGP